MSFDCLFYHCITGPQAGNRPGPHPPPSIDVAANNRNMMDRRRSPAILTSNHLPTPKQGAGSKAVGSAGASPAAAYLDKPAISKGHQQRLREEQLQRIGPHLAKNWEQISGSVGPAAAGVGAGVGEHTPTVADRGSRPVSAQTKQGIPPRDIVSPQQLQQQRLEQRRSQQLLQQQQQQQELQQSVHLDEENVGVEGATELDEQEKAFLKTELNGGYENMRQ